MIGIPLAASLGLLLAGMAVGVTADTPPRSERVAAERLVIQRAEAADRALRALEQAIAPAVDAARTGAARAVSGDEPPGPPLDEAARILARAEAEAAAARSALGALTGARRLLAPDVAPVEGIGPAGTLDSIAGQLSSTAAAAGAFAEMRARAELVTEELDAVVESLAAGDGAAAADHLSRAREHHDAIAAWDVGLPTLPVWLDTTEAMIASVAALLAASEAGDQVAAREVAAALAELSAEAAPADRALRIAIGEGGSALVAAPMGRLSDYLRSVADARAQMASIMRTTTR